MRKVLVIDVGGTTVKLMISSREKRKFESGPKLSPRQMVAQIKRVTKGWTYSSIAIGFPSVVRDGRITKDPKHLAKGWVGWDFKKSLGKPVRIMNDAAMQALGSYRGGRMLFLGLGTGLGSALVWQKNVLPLELGDLPYEGGLIEDVLGKPGFELLGKKLWEREVHFCIEHLKLSFIADYVMLGGGNAKILSKLPEGAELGHNRNAYMGGVRMWETDIRSKRPKWNII
jgi:polyphosphate glucokinase